MEFRWSEPQEAAAIRSLWVECFGDEQPWTDWYFSNHFRRESTWVGVQSNRVISQAHLLPHRLFLRGAWQQAAYFVGVCVAEAERGTGLGRAQMITAMAKLAEQKIPFAVLQPRWPLFYRKLGWEDCYFRQHNQIMPENLNRLFLQRPKNLAVNEWKPEMPTAIPVLSSIYEQFTARFHGFARREPEDWRIMLADHRAEGGRIFVAQIGRRPCGYILLKRSDEVCLIRELTWIDGMTVEDILGACAETIRREGTTRLEWADPSGEILQPGIGKSERQPFLMGRVLVVKEALEALKYSPEVRFDGILNVSDQCLPDNQGNYRCRIVGGLCRCDRIEADFCKAESGVISLDISQLGQWVFGIQSATAMEELTGSTQGCLKGDGETARLLDSLFPAQRNFISEMF